MLGPWVLKHAIDQLRENAGSGQIVVFALLIVGVAAVEGTFRFLMRQTIIGASRRIEYDLRNDFLRHLQRLPLSFYHKYRTGDLMARATNDLEAVRQVVGPAVMYFSNTIISMSAFVIMMSINVKLTLLAMIPFPLMAFAVQRLSRRLNKSYRDIQARYSDITSKVQENLSGMRVVKAYVQEDAEVRTFGGLNKRYIDENLTMARIRGLMTATMTFLVGAGALIVLWFGGRLVIRQQITLGEFVAFYAYLANLTWPMIALGWVINLFQQGTASMGRLNLIFDTKPAIADSVDTNLLVTRIKGKIEFRNVSFDYDDIQVLRNINLKIPAGMTLAITGPTGCGKSTLVNLLPRLVEATSGEVLIDGRNVKTLPLSVLRLYIGYVPQDTFLFSDTIAENIAFGVDNASPAELEEAAEISQIKKDIVDFPNGFETILGERGINISGGQKQRTAIARAVLRMPAILILDDSLSAVDTYTEEAILHQLRDVMKSRTSIIVSHRISTIKDADRIIYLEDGRIVEQGTHDQLVALGQRYAELHERQLLEEALEQY
jgi:ATP-binding cassette subfamily B protein